MALKLLGLIAGMQLASAHMEMSYPIPFNSKLDSAYYKNIDYSMTSPLDPSGANYPCKGYQSIGQDKIQATFTAGGSYNMSVMGTATHLGGSCQLSLSYDNGQSFRVIKSIIGNCPIAMTYDFVIPQDAPASTNALFAWTWFNYAGNREMYMNCARIAITGRTKRSRIEVAARQVGTNLAATALSTAPENFACNIGNGCSTVEGINVEFPNPGSVIERDQGTPNRVAGLGFNLLANVTRTGNAFSSLNLPVSTGSIQVISAVTIPPAQTAPMVTSNSYTAGQSAVSSGLVSQSSSSIRPGSVSTGGIFVPAVVSSACSSLSTSTGSSTTTTSASVGLTVTTAVTQTTSFTTLRTSTVPQVQTTSSAPAYNLPVTSCGILGQIICDTETTWSMCDYGGPVFMGSTAAGTKCVAGQIVPSNFQT